MLVKPKIAFDILLSDFLSATTVWLRYRSAHVRKRKFKMKKIVAFGNPLLDTTVYVKDNALLHKYDIPIDGQKEISLNEMKNLSDDISGYKQYQTAGGCAQNSLRVIQWLLNKQCDAYMFGSVGNDKDAELLKKLINEDGVKTKYTVQDKPTGKTIAIIKDTFRSLAAHIGAAEVFPLEIVTSNEEFKYLILESDYVYVEGFFLTNRTETANFILDFCNKNNKMIIFNICGEYVINICPEIIKHFVNNSDLVFGNKSEFEVLAKMMNFETITDLTADLIKKGKDKQHEKTIVLTDGPNPGMCINKKSTISFNVLYISRDELKDTTGAGDAFLGGFIAGLCKNKNLEICAKIGCYAAYEIIKQTGCTLPKFQPTINATITL